MEKTKKHENIVSIDIGHLSPKNAALAMRFMKDLVAGLDKVEHYGHGVSIFGSARTGKTNPNYKAAYKLGYALAKDGHSVVTGGGPGIMEAANKGAYDAGGRTLGLNISLPDEQAINKFVTDYISFRYFFSRKVMLAFAAKTYVFFPGGIGTLDEVSEILTLIQTKKIISAPIVLYGKKFWKNFDKFITEQMIKRNKTVEPGIRTKYYITDNIDEIVSIANRADRTNVERDAKEYIEQLLRK